MLDLPFLGVLGALRERITTENSEDTEGEGDSHKKTQKTQNS